MKLNNNGHGQEVYNFTMVNHNYPFENNDAERRKSIVFI